MTAAEAIARGEIVVVIDDAGREEHGGLVMAAAAATPARLAFFVRHTSGLVAVAMTDERADDLDLPSMVARHTDTPEARRPGHTEAALDLARLAGTADTAVLFGVVNLCGDVRTGGSDVPAAPDLRRFADAHGLVTITIGELIRHRMATEPLVERSAHARLPTAWGQFTAVSYESTVDGYTHLALVMDRPNSTGGPVVRVHEECLPGDVSSSRECRCRHLLDDSLSAVAAAGEGVVVYLRGRRGHPSRGPQRDVAQAVTRQILTDLGVMPDAIAELLDSA